MIAREPACFTVDDRVGTLANRAARLVLQRLVLNQEGCQALCRHVCADSVFDQGFVLDLGHTRPDAREEPALYAGTRLAGIAPTFCRQGKWMIRLYTMIL